MSIASCCLDFEHTVVDCQERHIEGSSSKIVDNDLTFITGAVKTWYVLKLVLLDGGVLCGRKKGKIWNMCLTVSDSCGGWLIDDSNDVQAGNRAGILRSLSLVVVEVRGNRDDRVNDLAVF